MIARAAAIICFAVVSTSAQPCTPCLSPCPQSACDAYLKRQAIESGFCGGEPCKTVSANSATLNFSGTAAADGAGSAVGQITTTRQATILQSVSTTHAATASHPSLPPDCSFVKFTVLPLPCGTGADGQPLCLGALDPNDITSADMAKALDWSKGAGPWFACRGDLVRDYRVYVLNLPSGVAAKHPIDYLFDRGFEFPNEVCDFERKPLGWQPGNTILFSSYGGAEYPFTDVLAPTLNDNDLHSAAIVNHEVVVHFRAPCQWRAFTYRWN